MREKDMFKPLKIYFNNLGYKVFPEIAGTDIVAVKENEHIAIEMKLGLNRKVVYQAHQNWLHNHKCYVAIYRNPRKSNKKIELCSDLGIGILKVNEDNTITVMKEANPQLKPHRLRDYSAFEERENDEAGVPCQKGIGPAINVLKRIKDYVKNNPNANWQEIYEKIEHHYASKVSLSGSMSQWKGFILNDYKKQIKEAKDEKNGISG